MSEGLDIKSVSIVVKLASKFWKKMMEHIDDDTVPKKLPSFAHFLFVKQADGGFTTALTATSPAEFSASILTEAKGKKAGGEPSKKKQKCVSDKSLKMGIFHMK